MLKNVYSRGVGGQKRAKFGLRSFWTPPIRKNDNFMLENYPATLSPQRCKTHCGRRCFQNKWCTSDLRIWKYPCWISKILFVLGKYDHFGSLRSKISNCFLRKFISSWTRSVLRCYQSRNKIGNLTRSLLCRLNNKWKTRYMCQCTDKLNAAVLAFWRSFLIQCTNGNYLDYFENICL